MSEHGLIIALKYGEKLKEFDDIVQIMHSVNWGYRKNNLKVLCLFIGERSL